jgi:alginate O-acetyltransferase complex protein AlgI
MGFHFLENFNRPYISQNFTEFWQRWHISLSRWMKEYLYIPLGGNRVSSFRRYINLWIVFLLSGFWHGANWTFIFWGAFHGFFLTLDKLFWLRASSRLPIFLRVALTFFFVLMSWIIFRSETILQAGNYILHMFGLRGVTQEHSDVLWTDLLSNRSITVAIGAAILSFMPIKLSDKMLNRYLIFLATGIEQLRFKNSIENWTWIAIGLVLFIMTITAMVNSKFHPFIYFQF